MTHPIATKARSMAEAINTNYPTLQGTVDMLTKCADLIDQITAPVSGDVEEMISEIEGDHMIAEALLKKPNPPITESGVRLAHKHITTLLSLLRSAQSESALARKSDRAWAESVIRAAYEDAAKIADNMAEAISNRTTKRLKWAEFCQEEMKDLAAAIRAHIPPTVDEGSGCVFCDMKITPVTAPDGKLFHEGRGGVCSIPCTNRARANGSKEDKPASRRECDHFSGEHGR